MTMLIKTGNSWSETRDFRVLEGGAFRRVQKAWVQVEGEWQEFYTYNPAIETSIYVDVTPQVVTSSSITISGYVTEQGTSARPPAGSVVELLVGGTKVLATTTNSVGAYSFKWTSSAPGNFSPTVRFTGNGVWQPSTVIGPLMTVNSRTSVSASYPTRGIIGESFTVTGSVNSSLSGTPTGTVYLDVLNGSSWSVGATASLSGGSYSLTWTPSSNWGGGRSIRVRYGGAGHFNASQTSTVSRTIYQPTPAAPTHTVTSLSHNSVNLRITDQANVDRYVTTCVETGFTVTAKSTGNAGAAINKTWSLGPNKSYTFKIVAYSNNPSDGSTSGNTLYVTTGNAAVTDKGSATFIFNAANTASWRSADGWGYLGTNLAQGYFNSAYGPYTGVAGFDVAFMRSFIDGYGSSPRTGRWRHLECTKFDVYASRVPAGANASVPIGWYLSSTAPGAGSTAPAISNGVNSSPTGLAVGTAGWLNIPSTNFGDQLVNTSGFQSIAMHYNGSAYYAQFAGGANFKIRVTYKWDWAPVPYVAPTWRSS